MKTFKRRDFLKVMGMGTGALTLNAFSPRFFISEAHAAANKRCVQIFLDGGCDWFTTHLKEGDSAFMSQYRIIRPTLSMPLLDNTGAEMARLPLNGSLYSLHFRLSELQSLYNSGRLAVINKCGVPQFNSGSHEEAQYHIKSGMNNGRSDKQNAGWMKRVANDNFSDTFQVFDRTGGGSATQGAGPFRPLALLDLSTYGFTSTVTAESNFRIDTAFSLYGQQEYNAGARDFVNSFELVESSVDRVKTAVQNTTFTVAFPTTSLGRQLRDVYIAFRNFPTQMAYTQIGGFDLHNSTDVSGQTRATPMGQSARMKEINDAIAAFRINCEAAGIWQDTTIVVNTEFGRTSRENGNKGVDHADAHVCFVLGGSVLGGHYGDDPTTEDINRPQNGIDATTASTDVYNEIVSHMGLSTQSLIPAGYTPRRLGLFG